MPDGPYPAPGEERLLDLARRTGSPEGAVQNMWQRLAALEALADQVEAWEAAQADETGSAEAESPAEPAEEPEA
ncbi:MAG: hypothetical protein ACK47B_16065 [Armatimonadota bacterium]